MSIKGESIPVKTSPILIRLENTDTARVLSFKQTVQHVLKILNYIASVSTRSTWVWIEKSPDRISTPTNKVIVFKNLICDKKNISVFPSGMNKSKLSYNNISVSIKINPTLQISR